MLKNNKHYYSFWEVKALSYTCLSEKGEKFHLRVGGERGGGKCHDLSTVIDSRCRLLFGIHHAFSQHLIEYIVHQDVALLEWFGIYDPSQ